MFTRRRDYSATAVAARHAHRLTVTGAALAALGAFATIVAPTMHATYATPPHSDRAAVADRPPAKGTPAHLVARFDCWTGPAPAAWQGRMPAGAVVTVNTRTRHTTRPAMIGRALDHALGSPEPGMTVHGFCAH